jgi:hypothetical protein
MIAHFESQSFIIHQQQTHLESQGVVILQQQRKIEELAIQVKSLLSFPIVAPNPNPHHHQDTELKIAN